MKNCFLACFYSFLMCLFLISCQSAEEERQELVEEKIKLITSNQEEWNDFNQKIYSKVSTGIIYLSDFDSTLQEEIKEKGIIDISISNFGGCKEIGYRTNWAVHPVGTFYLSWTPCSSEKTKKRYYKQDSFIEVWGVGEGWLILVDSDWI